MMYFFHRKSLVDSSSTQNTNGPITASPLFFLVTNIKSRRESQNKMPSLFLPTKRFSRCASPLGCCAGLYPGCNVSSSHKTNVTLQLFQTRFQFLFVRSQQTWYPSHTNFFLICKIFCTRLY